MLSHALIPSNIRAIVMPHMRLFGFWIYFFTIPRKVPSEASTFVDTPAVVTPLTCSAFSNASTFLTTTRAKKDPPSTASDSNNPIIIRAFFLTNCKNGLYEIEQSKPSGGKAGT